MATNHLWQTTTTKQPKYLKKGILQAGKKIKKRTKNMPFHAEKLLHVHY